MSNVAERLRSAQSQSIGQLLCLRTLAWLSRAAIALYSPTYETRQKVLSPASSGPLTRACNSLGMVCASSGESKEKEVEVQMESDSNWGLWTVEV